jgi:hypothetical protein
MRFRRQRLIPEKKRIYLGCEGKSEVGYASFLQDLLRDQNLPVHIVIQNLGAGAGDPLSRIELAVRHLHQLRSTREAPADRFIMLDNDLQKDNQPRVRMAHELATKNGILVIWQLPSFEALLLRHLKDCETLRPPNTEVAFENLLKKWPQYKKGTSRIELARTLDLTAIRRAAQVEQELATLLRCIGLST